MFASIKCKYRVLCHPAIGNIYICSMKLFLTFLVLITTQLVRAQQLSLVNLNEFFGQTVFQANQQLKSRGWIKHPELSGERGNQLYQTFAYGSISQQQGKAVAWFRIHADNQMVNQLYYQLQDESQLNALIKEILNSGAEKKEVQEIEDGKLNSYYIGYDFVYQAIIGNNTYTLMVVKKK